MGGSKIIFLVRGESIVSLLFVSGLGEGGGGADGRVKDHLPGEGAPVQAAAVPAAPHLAPRHPAHIAIQCKIFKYDTSDLHSQCCGFGSKLDLYSGTLWIRIRITNTDPDPHR